MLNKKSSRGIIRPRASTASPDGLDLPAIDEEAFEDTSDEEKAQYYMAQKNMCGLKPPSGHAKTALCFGLAACGLIAYGLYQSYHEMYSEC